MTDNFGQEQNINAEEIRGGYVSLLHADDQPIAEHDEFSESFEYPKTTVSNIGLASVRLFRPRLDSENIKVDHPSSAMVISRAGEKPTTQLDAVRDDNYGIWVEVSSPGIRRRGISGRVYLSLDGLKDNYYSDFHNRSEDDEDFSNTDYAQEKNLIENDTKLGAQTWRHIASGERTILMAKNDPEFLSRLGFRFDFIQPRATGGETN